MAAPLGNNYHLLRQRIGKGKTYAKPADLWEAALEYFTWCDANPWIKNEQLKKPFPLKNDDGEIERWETIAQIPTARPYTVTGLCLFLDIDQQTFTNYGAKVGYEDYFGVYTRIQDVIYNQKFEGASVGAFNAAIIARDLGLADKKEITNKGDAVVKVEVVSAKDPDDE